MKIVKNTILASILMVGLSSTVVAGDLEKSFDDTFGAITFTPDTDGGTIEGYKFDGSGMLGFLFGHKKLISDSIGGYGEFDMSYTTVDDTGTSNEAIYGYRIFNLGVTYSPMESLTLMGGIGYSWEKGEYSYYGTHYVTVEDHDHLNFHTGAMYNFTDTWGVIVGYNTAPSAYNIGISFSH